MQSILKLELTLTILIMFCVGVFITNAHAGQTLNCSITHDDLEREYILYIPDSYTGAEEVPLVLNFHGYGSNASQQMQYGDFRSLSEANGFILVHPQGTLFNGNTHWNVGGWTAGSTVDDVGFTSALIDAITTEYAIDLDRVYSTGMSNGGYMSFLLACQLSGKIAAIASVTGSMTPETYNDCNPGHPVPIMQFHGTMDPTVPYEGNDLWTKSIDDVLAYWVGANNCNVTPTTTTLPDVDPSDGSTVEHIVFDGGENGAVVEHFKVIGGAHTWPGSKYDLGGTNYDIDASVEIWEFFSRYDINGLINPPTPTPIPDRGVDLTLSQDLFQPGDEFVLTASIANPGPTLADQPFVVLLDVAGSYYWHPSWSRAFDFEPIQVDVGIADKDVLNFIWPDAGSAHGIRFYGALLSKDFISILGAYDMVEFGWGK